MSEYFIHINSQTTVTFFYQQIIKVLTATTFTGCTECRIISDAEFILYTDRIILNDRQLVFFNGDHLILETFLENL